MESEDKFEGIILYDIEKDDCINGVYTNKAVDGIIFNEIAKRIKPKEGDRIAGIYISSWVDHDEIYTGDLEISLNETNRTYTFKWKNIMNKCKPTNDSYIGVGFIMNEKQIAVHY